MVGYKMVVEKPLLNADSWAILTTFFHERCAVKLQKNKRSKQVTSITTSKESIMRVLHDLSGYWQGELVLNPELDVKSPPKIERDFLIPQCWNLQIEELLWPGSPWRELSGIVRPVQNQNFRDDQRKYNEGIIMYRRTVRFPPSPGDGYRAFMVFEGSNYHTRLSVNGTEIGTHDGGHLPFEFDITDALQEENQLEITVDNLRRVKACPQEQFNWRNYGGVYRPLRMEWRAPDAIDDIQIRTRCEGQSWLVNVKVGLASASNATLDILVNSGDETQKASIALDAQSSAQCELSFSKPLVWTPGVGGLSDATVILHHQNKRVDEQQITFGFRDVVLKGNRVHVNGTAIRLLGAAMHEQHPSMGNSVSAWQSRHDIKLLKNVGMNAVRTAHYPHARWFYEACDREGILVVADLPCWQFNERHFEDQEMTDFACDLARHMVKTLDRHPSIIGWNIETESQIHDPAALPFFTAIAGAFREADPERLLISASQSDPPEHLAIVKKAKTVESAVPSPVLDLVDLPGINDYSGWYCEKSDFTPRLLDHMHKEMGGNRALLVTEFGGESTPGQRSLTMEHYSEDYQAELITLQMKTILERDYIAGFFMWLFVDYQCASIGISGINSKGLVDQYRRPKLSYNQVRHLLKDNI